MRLRPPRLTAAVVLLAAAGTLAACSSSSASSSSASSAKLSGFGGSSTTPHPQWSQYTFVIGDNGGDGSQALAQITGVFADAPYKVTFARFTYGPPLIQAAASGDIDLGSVGDVPPITGAAQEYGFSVVGVAHYINTTIPDEDIIVPKGSPIQTVAQLRGKKIAVPQGSSAHGLVLLALKNAGLTPSDVQLDFLSPAAGATAFASGKVDAVICLACIIRGDTSHYEHLANEVTRGIGQSAQETGVPHAYGVLTCDSLEQAIDRAGLKMGNKGWDAALSAVEMASLKVSGRQSPVARKVASRKSPVARRKRRK